MLPNMSRHRREHAAAVVSGKLYVAGGLDMDGRAIGSAEVFDPNTNSWTMLPDMGVARCQASAIRFENKFFIFGGQECASYIRHHAPISRCEYFDPGLGSWHELPQMNVARCAPCLATIGEQIFVIGCRYAGGQAKKTAECLETSTATSWTSLPNLTHLPDSVAALSNRLYTTGRNRRLEIFDPDTWSWSTLRHPFSPRQCLNLVAAGSKLLMFAESVGSRRDRSSGSIFDPATNAWTNIPGNRNFNDSSHFLHKCQVVCSDKVYIFGDGSTVDVFDPADNVWSSTDEVPLGRDWLESEFPAVAVG